MRLFIFFLLAGWLLSGCANKVAPTGGTKDILPPTVVSVSPPQRSLNLTSGKIVITFDEYVQLKDINKQLVISPIISPPPRIYVLKKSVVIELPDSLRSNTTYTINFGNAIADNNEGNPLPQYHYTFSTGTFIDSLKVTGKILNAETGKPEKGSLALLYKSTIADSSLLKIPPDYFTRSSDEGNFVIENIRDGKYKLFGLVDKSNNYLLDPKDEFAGFEILPVDPKDSLNFEIRVAKQPAEKQLAKGSSIDEAGKLITAFTKPVTQLSWKFITDEPDEIIREKSVNNDTIIFYCLPAQSDSVKIAWYENEILIDTVLYKKARVAGSSSTAAKNNSAAWKSDPAQGGSLKGDSHPIIKWSAPVIAFDTLKIQLWKDSVQLPVSVSFLDSIQTQMQLTGTWSEGIYTLKLLPAAITDFFSRSNDSVVVTFTVPGERSIGTISYKLNSLVRANYILQLVNDKDEVIRQRFNSGVSEGTFEMVEPGIYRLRLITDNNNNHIWDAGDVRKGVQPEEIDYHFEKLTVRANWEVETTWNR
ncbi:MAG TPA: Ig-like domain-containing protein [Bacteroidia bacterium]|nr:Ig-like domain-containing protein [Bacteroidia bacterium]